MNFVSHARQKHVSSPDRPDSKMQKVKATLSLLVIAGVLAFFAFRYLGFPPKIDARPHLGIGQALAEEAAQLAGVGGRIIIVAPDVKVFRYPGAEVQLKAFRDALRQANLTVFATNWIRRDPLRVAAVEPGDFANLLRKYGEADVIVSLLGPPNLTAEQKAKLPPKRARVVALCSGDLPKQVPLQPLFDENLIQTAIISRSLPPASTPATDDPQKWFEHFYRVVTAKNLNDLPPVMRAALP